MTRPLYVLAVAEKRVELWRRKWGRAVLAASLDPASPGFPLMLNGLLAVTNGRPLALLLDLPDLVMRHETLPKVARLDRRKLLRSRREFLSHGTDIAGLFALSPERALFATQPEGGALRIVLQAIGRADARVSCISHAALESPALLPRHIRQRTGLAALKLPDSVLIIAHKHGGLAACRSLPANADLPAELRRTRDYLQRSGWPAQEAMQLTLIGLSAPNALPGLSVASVETMEGRDAWLELLAQCFHCTPRFPLASAYLSQRRAHRRMEGWLAKGAALVFTAALVLWVSAFLALHRMAQIEASLTEQLATLPPPLALTDPVTVALLDTNARAALPLLAAIPPATIQSLQLTLPNPAQENPVAGSARVTTRPMPPADLQNLHQALAQLPGWHLQENPQTIMQGGLAAEAAPQGEMLQLLQTP